MPCSRCGSILRVWRSGPGSLEVKAYFTGACLMLGWFIYSAFLAGQERFGFDQLKSLGPITAAGLILVAGLFLALVYLRDRSDSLPPEPLSYRKLIIPAVLSSLAAVPFFWFLRSGFINADGLVNMVSLQAGMKIVHHDEMLSTLLITRIWESGIAGFKPENAIALFSVFWGAVYVFLTVLTGGRMVGRRWPFFLALGLAGGFAQMFAGDVEFYAMVAALLSLFLLLSLEHTRGNISVIWPGFALLLAVFSHLLAGWVIPAYLFLLIRSMREKKSAEVWISLAVLTVTAVLLFILVSSAGLPVHWLTRSHAMGSADKTFFDMLAVPSIHYHAAVVNVLFLNFPFWGFLLLLFFFRRLKMDSFNSLLIISTGMLLILALVWNLGLGPYFDWNLIASVSIPASVMLWGNLLKGKWTKGMRTAVVAVLLVGVLHSWTWIGSNHFTFSMMSEDHLEEMPFPTGEPAMVLSPELQEIMESGGISEKDLNSATHIVDL